MRRLLPSPADIDIEDVTEVVAAYADERPVLRARPWVMMNMITSLDGATALEGRSGGLGGAGDEAVFAALRAHADVIVAGAATVRAEGYGPPSGSEEHQRRRRRVGAWPIARIAIVTNSLDLDLDTSLFAAEHSRPIVVTSHGSDARRRQDVAVVADVIVAGETEVDLGVALSELGRLGARVVLVEGGPRLNGQLAARGLVDEICLTIAPVIVSGSAARLAHGAPVQPPATMALAHVLVDAEGYLYLRYRRTSR